MMHEPRRTKQQHLCCFGQVLDDRSVMIRRQRAMSAVTRMPSKLHKKEPRRALQLLTRADSGAY